MIKKSTMMVLLLTLCVYTTACAIREVTPDTEVTPVEGSVDQGVQSSAPHDDSAQSAEFQIPKDDERDKDKDKDAINRNGDGGIPVVDNAAQ